MGIPSYFAHIVRTHRAIIKKLPLSPDSAKINNLYLDCNSFIYEAHHHLRTTFNASNNTDKNSSVYEKSIIKYVCDSLTKMIKHLNPTNRILIAFDGVAPMAKLNQQRNRRYMSAFQNSLLENSVNEWNTASITPGTDFMKRLGEEITKRFLHPAEFGLETIIVSTSDEAGEGEHKIYEYIRNNKDYHRDTKTIIYGLDADLIMLTLNHLHISENMYLYRETPEFIKHIDKTLNPNENYMLDIPLFAKTVINELSCKNMEIDKIQLNNDILFDYILLCFFLGNDFLPLFPALNIRTNGINNLINAYKFVFSGTDETLTKNREIVWKNMRKFIGYLEKNELDYIKEEYTNRAKLSKWASNNNRSRNDEQQDENLLLPLKDRAHEIYINPNEVGWESRYYKVLFNTTIDDDRKKEICTNYLEGLEWTMKYYSTGCVDWRWMYNYYYPPLLTDLIKYVPYFDHTFLPFKPKNPVLQLTQLSYVLPPSSMGLIPYNLHKKLLKEHPEWYVGNYIFLWAFCKFFWEAHVELPHIDINKLENIVIS